MFGTGWCRVSALAGEMHSCLPDDEGQGEGHNFPGLSKMADSQSRCCFR